MHAATFFVALSILGLGWALAVGDLTYRYVANWASFTTPLPYRLGAVWAGPSGALLGWALALGGGSALAAASLRRGGALRAWTSALLALLLLAVLGMACFDTNPFTRLPFPPEDGRALPLEWMRPVVLLQMPLGYAAMALLSAPAVMTVMGALGRDDAGAWRVDARRWSLLCWALLGLAMLLDWRRRYGDSAWADDWRWAPVHSGTAFAWVGASLLVLSVTRRWRTDAAVMAGFAAFTLGLVGLTLRRAMGWEGVHDFAGSTFGPATGWVTCLVVVLVVIAGLRAALRGGLREVRGTAALAALASLLSTLVATGALVVTGVARASEVELREGGQTTITDRFGTPWVLSLEGLSTVGRGEVVTNVVALRAAVGGRARAFVAPEIRSRYDRDGRRALDEVAVAGVASGLAQDLRVDVREANSADALLTVRFIPAVTWLWIAGAAAALAALVAALTMPAGSAAFTPSAAVAPVPADQSEGA